MKINEYQYSRGKSFFDPKKQKFNIKVFGAGSIGSMTILNLAKLGFRDLTVYDFDKIELPNIANQFYRIGDIGKFKVNALKDIVKDFSGIDICIRNKKITTQNAPELISDINMNTLVVLAFDNLEARKLVYDVVKDFPLKLIDLRMGGVGWEQYVVDLSNNEEKNLFEKTLNQPTVDLPCGEQSICFNIFNIASEACNTIVKIDRGLPFNKILKRSMNSYYFIGE